MEFKHQMYLIREGATESMKGERLLCATFTTNVWPMRSVELIQITLAEKYSFILQLICFTPVLIT